MNEIEHDEKTDYLVMDKWNTAFAGEMRRAMVFEP